MPDSTPFTGLYPVYENQFKVSEPGGSTKSTIAEMESFGVAFNNGIEEWSPMEAQGWLKRMLTAKNVVITVNGKRRVGDTGNDLIAGKAFATGTSAEVDFDWTFPDGTVVSFANAVVNVTACGSGDSTNVGPLEFEIQSNGKPTVTLPS